MKKKALVVLFAAVLTVSIFTGCGNRMEGDGKVQAAMANAESGQNDSSSESGAEGTAATESEPETTTESEGSSASEAETADSIKTDVTDTAGDVESTDSEDMTVEVDEESGYSFIKTDEIMYASSGVNVRDLPSTDGSKVDKLVKGQEVTVTGQCVETGWYRIVVNGQEMYVSNSYLTTEKSIVSTNGSGSGSASQPGTGTSASTGSQTTSSTVDVSKAFMDYLNQQRAAAGLSAVTWDSSLASDAKTRAVEISSDFNHDSRTDVFENILGIGSSSVSDWFEQWYNSEGHRLTMMNPNLTNVGVAFYEENGYYYVVLLAHDEVPVMSAEEWNEAKEVIGHKFNL